MSTLRPAKAQQQQTVPTTQPAVHEQLIRPDPLPNPDWKGDARRMGLLRTIDAQFGLPYADPREELDRQEIVGEVRNADGSPVPEDLEIMVSVHGTRPQGRESLGRRTQFTMKVRHGRFDETTKFGYVWFTVDHPGFAPQLLGPMLTTPGGSLKCDIVLEAGFTARVRVVDQDGQPIAGARITAMRLLNGEQVLDRTLPSASVSDAGGVISIPHSAEAPTRIFVVAEGFVDRDPDLNWSLREESQPWNRDRVIEHRMPRAMPVTGRVLSPDGKPAVGAKLFVTAISISNPMGGMTMGREPDQSIAVTNDQGDFVITTISTRGTVTLMALATDGGRAIVDGVKAGTSGLMLQLRPAATLRGKLKGQLDRIVVDGKPTVYFDYEDDETSLPYAANNDPTPSGYHEGPQPNTAVEVRVTNGTGEFEIPRLYHGTVILGVAGERSEYRIDCKDLSVDINVPAPPSQGSEGIVLQEVAATLVPPQGREPAEGFVRFAPNWDYEGPGCWSYRGERFVAVHRGKVSLNLPSPNSVTLYSDALVGYSFPPVRVGLGTDEPNGLHRIEAKNGTVIPLLPAGAVYGSLGFIPYGMTIYAQPKVPDEAGFGDPRRYNGAINESRRTYVIHSVPLGTHVGVFAECYNYNEGAWSTLTLIDDVILNDQSPALRFDVSSETLKKWR